MNSRNAVAWTLAVGSGLVVAGIACAGCGPSERDKSKYTSREKLAAQVMPGVVLEEIDHPSQAARAALLVHLEEFENEFGTVPPVTIRLYGGRRPFLDPRPGAPPNAQLSGLYWPDDLVWLWAGNDDKVYWTCHELFHALLHDAPPAPAVYTPYLFDPNPYGIDGATPAFPTGHAHTEWWRADVATSRALARLP